MRDQIGRIRIELRQRLAVEGRSVESRQHRVVLRTAWFAIAAAIVAPWAGAVERHALLGAAAPDFAARAVSGGNVRLSEHRGDVVVVTFWSGRCNPCRDQLAALDRIAKTYRSAGLIVMSLNLDDNVERATEFARSQAVSFPMVVETDKDVGRQYAVDTLPLAVFIDRRGKVRRVQREWRPRDEISYVRAVRALLNE
jgi:peroxiredoxin